MHLLDTVRRRAGALIVDSFFRSLSVAGRLHPNARPQKHNVERITDVPYLVDGTRDHLLDVYRPTRGAGPWPVVLYVHGGGFRILSKDSHWLMGLAFARRGFVVFNINYRLAPRNPFPAAVEDVCDAFCWVVEHARDYGGDPRQLVLAGESAGANLITALTLCTTYQRPEPMARRVWATGAVPDAVLPYCGLLQVSDPERFARRRSLPRWLRDRMEDTSWSYLAGRTDPASLELADPLLVMERGIAPERRLPPFFAAVGTRDPILDDTRRLKAALDGLGVPCEARYYQGEPHAFNAMVWRQNAKRCWRHTYAFLDRCLAGEPVGQER